MAYDLKQQLRLTQSLVMTPQLQLAIRLLQMSRLDLVETVKEELETNPVLEDNAPSGESVQSEENKDPTPEMDWQSYLEEQGTYTEARTNFSDRTGDDEDDFFRNISSADGGLNEHLVRQLHMQDLSEEDKRIGEFIIGNIDEDGYLRILSRGQLDDDGYEAAVVDEISRYTGESAEKVQSILKVIHGFDPSGVGARTPRECLLTQAKLLPVRDTLVEEIIARHLTALAAGRFKAIAKDLSSSEQDVRDAARVINRQLNPTPGSGFGSSVPRQIIPDVYIRKIGDEYVVSLNEDGLPKLKISKYYRDLLTGKTVVKGQTKEYLQERLKSAMWLIKSLHQRQRTIYSVVECLVKFQKDFLDRGLKFLKPLVLKDVAADLGIHESTVSRVTSNKYAETPRGLFELKYFFSNSMPASDGAVTTPEYIKEKLRAIIEAEDPARPLSDQEIVRILEGSGLKLARRTVAKYRESLGFLSSSGRKTHF